MYFLDPPLNVTLFAASYNTNHAEAEDICSKRGEKLLEMEDAAKQATIMFLFSQDPWKDAKFVLNVCSLLTYRITVKLTKLKL